MLGGDADQPRAQQRSVAHVVGGARDLGDNRDGVALGLVGAQVRQVEHRQLEAGRRTDDLDRIAVDGVKGRVPRLVAGDESVEGRAQRVEIERTVLAQRDRLVVGEGRRGEQRPVPERLLRD